MQVVGLRPCTANLLGELAADAPVVCSWAGPDADPNHSVYSLGTAVNDISLAIETFVSRRTLPS